MLSSESVNKIIHDDIITEDEVNTMRKAMYGDDYMISINEANLLFQINDKCNGKCNAWPDFFVEAITDFICRQKKPVGYVDQTSANWLIKNISHSGLVKTETELEVLVKILEVSLSIPENLQEFAIEQIRHAVLHDEGATRANGNLKPGQIGRAEVEILRSAFTSLSGDNGLGISKREAEVLFEINDAVADMQNDPIWSDFFARSISNYLMASFGYQAPSRDEALKKEKWLDDTDIDIQRYFSNLISGFFSSTKEDKLKVTSSTDAMVKSEMITQTEADWVIEKIERDGKLTDAEKALLLFIKHNSHDIHPNLLPLIEQIDD